MSIKEPVRRRSGKNDANSKKLASFTYQIEGKDVCKKTLLDVFSITFRRIQTLQSKLKNGVTIPRDQRGRHSNRPHALKDTDRDLVRQHIRSFPKQPSHYSRAKTEKECLSPDLNLGKMYRLFKVQHPNVSISRTLYQRIFYDDFKLRFGVPRSDSCKYCDMTYVKLVNATTEEERNKISTERELHHRKAEAGYKNLNEDKNTAIENQNIVVLCVDLQQVLFCPTLTHSSMFYQRQLSCYNFNIHNLGTNRATMHLWDETIAKRGSADIASCIFKYITSNYEKLQRGEQRTLIVWSDRCVGQNNNWKMIALYFYLIQLGFFSEVHQKFLCSGHSFLPCDRDFAQIERVKKTAKVMVPLEWKDVIAEACINSPFSIVFMKQEDFKNFDELEKLMNKTITKITDAMWIKLSWDNPTTINIRKSHNIMRPWEQYDIIKKKRGPRPTRIVVPCIEALEILYDTPLKISKEKKDNLIDMTQYLDDQYKIFYHNLACEDA